MHFLGSFLQVFHNAGQPQRVDCLTHGEFGVKCLSKDTTRRIANAGIESGVSNFSITSPTLYH